MENPKGQQPKTKPPRIIRAPRENPYFLVARATAQDKALSWSALGVLTYLLSKPDHWETKVADLYQRRGCKRDKARAILKELQDNGYLLKVPRQGAKGLLEGWDWHVHEIAVPLENRLTVGPSDGKHVPIDNTEGKDITDQDSLPAGAGTAVKKQSISDPLKKEIAVKILGLSEDLAAKSKHSGILAAAAARVWVAYLRVEKLNKAQYEAVTRSIDPFVEDWNKLHKGGLNLPQGESKFETAYGNFVTRSTSKAVDTAHHYDPACPYCRGGGVRTYADGADECECWTNYKGGAK